VLRLAATLGRVSLVDSLALGRGASTSRTIRSTSSSAALLRLLRSIGVVPVSSSYSNTPSEYTSERVSMSRLFRFACSGDMYSGVPTTAPNPVTSVLSVRDWPVALATPKSMTLGTGWSSYSATSTLEGLMAR
jgi:hypothetical protein